MVPKPQTSSMERDLRRIVRVARACGCWPLRDLSSFLGQEKSGSAMAWREKEDIVACGPWQEMSWKSIPPYYTIFVTILFSINLSFHVYNTAVLASDSSLEAADVLVSVPWIGYLAVPIIASLVLLVRAHDVASFLARWRCLEQHLNLHLPCRPGQHYPVIILTVYFLFAVVSIGFLVFELVKNPHASYYIGNMLPGQWSWAGHVVQHILVVPTWASIIVTEVLIVTIAHHIASYYAALNVHLQKLFASRTSQSSGGRVSTYLRKSKSASVSVIPHSPLTDAANHSLDEDFQQQLQQKLCLREGVDELLDAFNAIFAFIVLANFTMITLVIVTLLPPVIKNKHVLGNIAYLVNSISCLIRLPIVVLGQACVHDQASNTRLVVSKFHKRLAMAGESLALLPATLEQLAARQDDGISAWGCFTVMRGTVLTISSFIVSYVVLIIQS